MCNQSNNSTDLTFTPNPDGPLPGPFPPQPGPFPPVPPFNPFPQPQPWQPHEPLPDFSCLRFHPVSGTYIGSKGIVVFGPQLELRVDIDPITPNSPVMNRLSGDFFYRTPIVGSPGLPGFGSVRRFDGSWVVDAPTISWARCKVTISGRVRFYTGTHPVTDVSVVIPWHLGSGIGPAQVTFSEAGGAIRTFSAPRRSNGFRKLELELDVCASVNIAPLTPTYDTSSHPNRPADTPQRTLTIAEAYREAGVEMTVTPASVIDDSNPAFVSWSPAELHDVMETSYSRFGSAWPAWRMWGVMAGKFENPGVGGIMFDAAASFGGAGRAPERQGFAVFRNHPWFANLVPNPGTVDQAEAMRKFLYTYVHEAGHAFNLLHSWNKSRPNSLSWMNYDWKYDQLNGADAFWANFRMRFDDDELIHIRHGERNSVIMGGDPWASGGHAEEQPHIGEIEGEIPLELLVRSKDYFEFLEPVSLELRLRNPIASTALTIDARLDPQHGLVKLFIRRPNNSTLTYQPSLCLMADPVWHTLQANGVPGEDRHSQEVFVGYGHDGFYFDEPGEYQVRAVYEGPNGLIAVSAVHRLRIGRPTTQAEDRVAHAYFSDEVGLALALGGSQSPYLAKGMALIESLAAERQDSLLGARLAGVVANSVGRPFFRLDGEVLTQTHQPDPKRALALTTPGIGVYHKKTTDRTSNLGYERLVRVRANQFVQLGETDKARKEVATMRKDLSTRGVNAVVLDSIKTWEDGL